MGFVPALVLLFVSVVLTVAAGVWTATFAARRRFRRATTGHVRAAEKETPLTALTEDHADRLVFARGRLNVRDNDGRRFATVTVGDVVAELVGAFTIMAAERIEDGIGNDPRASVVADDDELRLSQAQGERVLILEDGDEVVVRAMLARTVERVGGYRTPPTERWWLGHKARRSTISHGDAKPEVPPIPEMLRRRFSVAELDIVDKAAGFLGAALVALTLLGTTAVVGDVGGCEARCTADEPCGFSYDVFNGGPTFDCGYGAVCAPTEACLLRGVCTGGFGKRCEVGSDADCRGSRMCSEKGACWQVATGSGTICAPKSDQDCAQTVGCTRFEMCTYAAAQHRCVKASFHD